MNNFKQMLCSPKLYVVFIIPFLAWMYMFRGFIFGDYTLITDAMVYYDHFKYYIENIAQGIFPFWDPGYGSGMPFEFFLRRIGEFNPFYLFILIPYKLGLPFLVSFMVFLGFYYFFGMMGFYLVSLKIFKDERVALVAYLLLLFSSLSTLVFCSFIVLIFTPMAWFFYFLITFYEKRERHAFLGMTFCLMIFSITYIPFYFLLILIIFFMMFIVFYFKEFIFFCRSFILFFKENKLFAALCILILCISLVPATQFYLDSKQGELTLPTRHFNGEAKDELTVPVQRSAFGGIIPHLVVNELYFGAKDIRLSRIYVPFFFNFLLLMVFVVKLNRRSTFIFCWGYLCFIVSIYDAVIYQFLYQHVFFFKYFRNFQFFFWLAVLPIFVLLLAEQFRLFLELENIDFPKSKGIPVEAKTANASTGCVKIIESVTDVLVRNSGIKKYCLLSAIVIMHVLAVIFLVINKINIVTYYVVIGLSFIFFISFWKSWHRKYELVTLAFLLVTVLVDPIQVYSYLNQNSKPFLNGYRYDTDGTYPYRKLILLNDKEALQSFERKAPLPDGNNRALTDEKSQSFIYIGSKWFNLIYQNIDHHVLSDYLDRKLLVFDRVEYLNDQEVDISKIAENFMTNQNLVFISSREGVREPNIAKVSPNAEIITRQSTSVRVIAFDINSLKLKTNLNVPKFLVYNDTYSRDWQVFINGHKETVLRANFAFKGVWVPAGENVVYFRFGGPGKYFQKLFYLVFYFVIFLYLCLVWIKDLKGQYFQYPWKT